MGLDVSKAWVPEGQPFDVLDGCQLLLLISGFSLFQATQRLVNNLDALTGVVVQFEKTQAKLEVPQIFCDISLKLACISFLSGWSPSVMAQRISLDAKAQTCKISEIKPIPPILR